MTWKSFQKEGENVRVMNLLIYLFNKLIYGIHYELHVSIFDM